MALAGLCAGTGPPAAAEVAGPAAPGVADVEPSARPPLPVGADDAATPIGTTRLTPVALGEAPLFRRASPIGDVTYTAGRGLRLGDTGLTIGGYSNLVVSAPETERGKVELDDTSIFLIWDPSPRVHVFSELEYGDVFAIDDQANAGSPDDAFTADRLYVDLSFTDLLNLRGGIFRTPVGRWNVIHAPPLVWTTEQPLVTEEPFDLNLTGLMLFGSLFQPDGVLGYSLYGQFADPLEGNPEFEPADSSVGTRVEWAADSGWSVGASFLAARRDGHWSHLGGLDLLITRGRFELMGELTIEDGGGDGGEGGGYLQGVWGLTDRVYLVGRFEHYQQPEDDPRLNLITLGIGFRPFPAVVLKAEYVIANRLGGESSPGFYASVATLF